MSPFPFSPMGPILPPVGEDDGTPFETALHAVFDRNEQTGRGPVSVRALAKELARGDNGEAPPHKKVEEWRRRVRRYMSGERQPRPDTLAQIATAAGATVGDFPAVPGTGLRQRVEALERELREVRALLDRPQENA